MREWKQSSMQNTFLISKFAGGEWSALRFGLFTQGRRMADVHFLGGSGSPTAGREVVAKRKIPAPIENRLPVFQYEASQFTN
jgi:hypothetical protein